MTGSKKSGIVILISGRGSNMQAILEAVKAQTIPADVRAVISSNPGAEGLRLAQARGIPTQVVPHRDYTTREAFDAALQSAIDAYDPQLVVLAGFMRILTPAFIRHYDGHLINIHPSLLPQFPGLNTHQRALDAGARQHGATVHFVIPEVDSGPVIIQATVPVLANDTAETLAARVLEQEHRIFPLAVKWFVERRLSVRDGRVLLDGATQPEQGLAS
jgi:phosphoribosylglycinamide formyltransferase-1